MYEGARIGVVVPAYNEEPHIREVIDAVPEFVDRLYVVDDRSTDGTWAEIKACADAETVALPADAGHLGAVEEQSQFTPFPEESAELTRTVVPVRHSVNRGRGGAVKTGYHFAMVEGLDVVAVVDGDGQMDPEILDRIIDPVVSGKGDYAKGNRLVDPDCWGEMSRWRLFGNSLLTVMTKFASGYYHLRDPQNGYTAVTVETLADIPVGRLYEDYGFLNDMLIRLGAHKKSVVDVPMEAIYDDEESGIEYRSFVPWLSWLLLKMFVWRIWVTYGPGNAESSSFQPGELLSTGSK
jgi:glycosyltransferase involved in cell wall biosynthesis